MTDHNINTQGENVMPDQLNRERICVLSAALRTRAERAKAQNARLRAALQRACDRMYVHQGATTKALVAEIQALLAEQPAESGKENPEK